MPGLVPGVRGLCGVLCVAETRAATGLCWVCGVFPYVCVRERPDLAPNPRRAISRTYAAPHTPHAPHSPRWACFSAVRRPVRGRNYPAQVACSRAGAPIPSFSLEEDGRGGLA
jgi:hypothetical protein